MKTTISREIKAILAEESIYWDDEADLDITCEEIIEEFNLNEAQVENLKKYAKKFQVPRLREPIL